MDNTATGNGVPPTGPAITTPPVTELVPTPLRDPRLFLAKLAELVDANGNG